jgi:hypothetical protein
MTWNKQDFGGERRTEDGFLNGFENKVSTMEKGISFSGVRIFLARYPRTE